MDATALKRLGTPEDIAGAVAFLVSRDGELHAYLLLLLRCGSIQSFAQVCCLAFCSTQKSQHYCTTHACTYTPTGAYVTGETLVVAGGMPSKL